MAENNKLICEDKDRIVNNLTDSENEEDKTPRQFIEDILKKNKKLYQSKGKKLQENANSLLYSPKNKPEELPATTFAEVYNGAYLSKSTFYNMINREKNTDIAAVLRVCVRLRLTGEEFATFLAIMGKRLDYDEPTTWLVYQLLSRQIYESTLIQNFLIYCNECGRHEHKGKVIDIYADCE